MDIQVTAITAGLLSIFLLVLSVRVVRLRRKNRVSIGHGDSEELHRAVRGQANCAEYAPIGILLLLIAELQSVWVLPLVLLAAMLLVGRFMHGYAFAFTTGNMFLRSMGMRLTIGAIVVLALTNLAMPLVGWIG